MHRTVNYVIADSVHRRLASLQRRHNGHDGIWNHQPHDCLLNRLFRRRSKKISKLCVTGLCAGNSPVTCVFPAQMASDAENVYIWWRHHDLDHFWFIANPWERISFQFGSKGNGFGSRKYISKCLQNTGHWIQATMSYKISQNEM